MTSTEVDQMTTPIINAEVTFTEIHPNFLDNLDDIKIFQRLDELDKELPICYFCCFGVCCGFIRCCGKSTYDIVRVTCCRCFIPPKRKSWNRRFDLGVSILGNVMHNAYPHKKSVPIMRLLADHDLPTWLPFFPKHVLCKTGKKTDGFINSYGHEWLFPKAEGYPNFDLDITKQRKFILYLHGGAFVIGGPFSHRLLAAELSKETGCTILVIVYRRAPEFPYPIPELDCLEAYKWLCSKVDSSRIMLAGDSAGGALVIGVLTRIRDENLPKPKCGILLSPWVDLYENETESCLVNNFIDYIPARLIPFAGQLYCDPPDNRHASSYLNLVGIAPLIIEVGESEVLRDSILKFIRKAIRAGVQVEYNVYPDMVHVFQLLSFSNQEQPRQSFKNIAQYIEKLYTDDIESHALIPEHEKTGFSAIAITNHSHPYAVINHASDMDHTSDVEHISSNQPIPTPISIPTTPKPTPMIATTVDIGKDSTENIIETIDVRLENKDSNHEGLNTTVDTELKVDGGVNSNVNNNSDSIND